MVHYVVLDELLSKRAGATIAGLTSRISADCKCGPPTCNYCIPDAYVTEITIPQIVTSGWGNELHLGETSVRQDITCSNDARVCTYSFCCICVPECW
mmetsp:Transcript_32067/g.90045  ORF Transcript_32067/g.90045 Transcript_32067/m.90045 type:complete len:97 (-) Transcript_32067:977-1267(-)